MTSLTARRLSRLHRFHHVASDDARCIDAASVAATTTAFRNLLAAAALA